MLAKENEYVSDAAETMFQSSQDAKIRTYCEAVEEARRLRRGLEIQLERAESALNSANKELTSTKEELGSAKKALQQNELALHAKDEEIAKLKAQLSSLAK